MTEKKKRDTKARVQKKAQDQLKGSENKPDRLNIGIKVDRSLWRRFRAVAVRKDVNAGDLLDRVIEEYLKEHEYDK